ncbi:hypothetical protein C8R32_11324 [Nitrosospira sp. Nsp5]|uniref:Uncharacterized protein n=1 Tax=Nitrosospira multiformis TaxID=1231 RepID=A0ABY0TMV5_9PROT|nr:hypothetical protein C8R32_11324 [Nitrosospira sp. Nsp5]SDQ85822.1 hypothetical protein SAMN05216402_2573 [Nitrosospira multiformis]
MTIKPVLGDVSIKLQRDFQQVTSLLFVQHNYKTGNTLWRGSMGGGGFHCRSTRPIIAATSSRGSTGLVRWP